LDDDTTGVVNDMNEIPEGDGDVFISNAEEKSLTSPMTNISEIDSAISNEVSPTSPQERTLIENINERISRLIDTEDTINELYNAARIKGILHYFYYYLNYNTFYNCYINITLF